MKYTRSFTFIILAFNIILAQFPNMNDSFNELEGDLSMYFFNAINGKPVKGAKIKLKGIDEFTSDANGKYEYRIEDFTNRNKKSDKLSKSGAEVKVYAKGRMMYHFKAPVNQRGNNWTVFKIKNNEIISINTIGSK